MKSSDIPKVPHADNGGDEDGETWTHINPKENIEK